MTTVDIFDFRTTVEKGEKKEIPNVDLITNLLVSKGLASKEFGLCADPFDKYFNVCNTDERGVSSVKSPLNTIHVKVNSNTSTRRKITYFYSITINYIGGFYYLCCLAQYRFNGAQHIVYKTNESEISSVIDEIFNNVSK